MKIIKNLMEKKIENEEMLKKALNKNFAYGEHISVYLMALFYLNLNDPLLSKKKRLWRRFMDGVINHNLNNQLKYYRKLLRYKLEEDKTIIMALNKMEEEKGEKGLVFGSMYKPYTWGVQSYEYHAEE